MDEERGFIQTSRSITREVVRIGNFFSVSACKFNTVKEWENQYIFNPSIIEINPRLLAKQHLMHQLQTVKKLSLQLAYQEYLGMLPLDLHPKDPVQSSSMKSFVDSLMSRNNGIPVLILNVNQSERLKIVLLQV